jgi:putative FmdB family regulatory protein
MPVYEYACTKCGHHFEQRRKVTDPPASRCPECRCRVKRVYAPVGIIFKGSGFHVTDYGRNGAKDAAPAAAPAPAAAAAPSTPSTASTSGD